MRIKVETIVIYASSQLIPPTNPQAF